MPRKLIEQERASDLIDDAANMTQIHLEKDIANARAGVEPESHPDFDGKHCVEEHCGVAIPKGRLEHGRVRCVNCQAAIEERRRRRL